jgi:hypothetical protein
MEMRVDEVVRAQTFSKCPKARPVLPKCSLLEINGHEATRLPVPVRFTELRLNACALPAVIGEGYLNVQMRSHSEARIHNIRNLEVDAAHG